MKPYLNIIATISVVAATSMGCQEAEENRFEHACDHVGDSPLSVIADAVASVDAPDISQAHTNYEVSFTEVDGGLGGAVTFGADESGDYALVLSADVPLTLSDASGDALTLEETMTSPCDQGGVGYVYLLSLGTTQIEFGPTSDTSVELVVEHLEDHDH